VEDEGLVVDVVHIHLGAVTVEGIAVGVDEGTHHTRPEYRGMNDARLNFVR
jgi:hypothetical protein